MLCHLVDVNLHFLQLVFVVLAFSSELSLQCVLLALIEKDLELGQDLHKLLIVLNDLVIQLF